MKSLKTLALAALISTASLPVFAEEVTAATVVAKVGDVEITVGHMIAMTASLPDEQRRMAPADLFAGVLERLVQQEAVAQSMDTVPALVALQSENEHRSLLASAAVNALAARIEVTPEAVQAAYDEKFKDFVPGKEFNASHILVETEDEAKALIAELEGGADFADMARQHSTGPSGPNGGVLGWFGAGQMVPDFEAAVMALEEGQISGPVQTQFGWHVVKLNETRIPSVPTLAESEEELKRELFTTMLREEIQGMIDSATVERMDVSGIAPEVVFDGTLVTE